MNLISATIRGLRLAPVLLSALTLSVLLLSGCASSTREGLTSNASTPLVPGASSIEEPDSPETWSGYRLYIEAMLARKAEDYATSAAYLTTASEKDPSALILKRELAVVYLLAGKKEKALEVIDGILADHPDDADSLLLLVRIRLAERRAGQAEKLLKRVIESDPTREEAYFRLGLLQTTIGKRDNALETYLKLLEAYPYAYAGHYYAALLYKEKGDEDKAVHHLKESLDIAPEFIEARLELADILVSRKQYDEAKAQYRLALTHSPGDLHASLAMALLHDTLEEEEQARKLYDEITASADRWPEIYTLINQQYIERRKYSEAHRLLTGVMTAYKDNSEFNYMLGFVCEKLGDSEEAIQCFTRISPASDYYERAILFVSVQLWEQGRQDEAIQTLEEAREQQPESIEILNYLASFYEEQKAYDKAEACLLKAISLTPEDPTLHFRIGVLYDKWGKSEASTNAMKRALELDPEDPNALNYLGYTYARQGIRLEDAERLIKKALEYKPGDGYITDSLGWVYYQKGQYSKALSTLREAAALLPDDPVVMEHLGDALVQNNLTQEALNYYRESLKLGHEDAPAIRKKIRTLEESDTDR